MDLFFFVGSLYSYFAVMRAEIEATRRCIPVCWRPFNLRAIMVEQSNVPSRNPVKLRYIWRDVERRAKQHDLPFKAMPPYPVDPEGLASRVAVIAAMEGWCAQYARATYLAWFAEHKVPGNIVLLRAILASIGRDAESVIVRADSPEIRQRFDAETNTARSLGIFGAPTFVVGNEIFWGDDRLEDALQWATAR